MYCCVLQLLYLDLSLYDYEVKKIHVHCMYITLSMNSPLFHIMYCCVQYTTVHYMEKRRIVTSIVSGRL